MLLPAKFSPGRSICLIINQLKSELDTNIVKISRQFARPALPKNQGEIINLHLGCGSVNHPKFINIDARPAPHVHYVRDIDNLSPFKENSVDLIYACHCLEHFSHAQTQQILSEWYRVLKKKGILRLSVPDFDLILNIYKELNENLEPIIGLLMGGQDYKCNFHKTLFNTSSLKNVLLKAGFSEVRPWQPGQCEMTTFNDWSGHLLGEKYPVSLNFEAIKL